MSWDILIFNSDKSFDLENADLQDFESKKSVIEKINSSFPGTVWNDESWGSTNSEVSIEFNLGRDIGSNFMLHVRGGGDPAGQIVKMCSQYHWIAYDTSDDKFIDDQNKDDNGFEKWQNYRDQIVNEPDKKPWWKFWGKT